MISVEKWSILIPLQKFPENVGDLGKLIVAKGFKKLPKVQKIAQSGHTSHSWKHSVSKMFAFSGPLFEVEIVEQNGWPPPRPWWPPGQSKNEKSDRKNVPRDLMK